MPPCSPAEPPVCPESPSECGNWVLDPGEQCDDGNLVPGDGCDGLCQDETIGGTTIRLIPVDAGGTHTIIGHEIILDGGGQIVTLEIRLDNWDPVADVGVCPDQTRCSLSAQDCAVGVCEQSNGLLQAYQARIDASGYGGVLRPATAPCIVDEDCEVFGAPRPSFAKCDTDTGECAPGVSGFIDTDRADFLFSIYGTAAFVDNSTDNRGFASCVIWSGDAKAFAGVDKYGGTLVLEVPDDAKGTFTIGFVSDPKQTLMRDNTSAVMFPVSVFPAVITVHTDCNNNGVIDQDEIEAGTALDCNDNLLPDECDIAAGTSQDCTGNGIPDECEPDCNDTGTPDSCDTIDGTSEDCNGNEIPDECDFAFDCNGNGTPDTCECLPAASPRAEPEVIAKNRYLSFVPDPSNPGCNLSALRVTLSDLPPAFEEFEGASLWVGEPHPISEIAGFPDPNATPPTFTGARLQCTPHCTDWSAVGLVHAFGRAVVPGGSYAIQAVACACNLAVETNYSIALDVPTGKWGDVAPPLAKEGNTQPDFVDISGVVDKFMNSPEGLIKPMVDLAENGPDTVVDFVDISSVVDAFRGQPYPFNGPRDCP